MLLTGAESCLAAVSLLAYCEVIGQRQSSEARDWLIVQANGTRDPKIYVWDVELDLIQFFNFATGCDESDDVMRQPSAPGDADVTAAERFYLLASCVTSRADVVTSTKEVMCVSALVCTSVGRYGDSAGNTVEEKSIVFSLIRMR